jgi:hypothetical protein
MKMIVFQSLSEIVPGRYNIKIQQCATVSRGPDRAARSANSGDFLALERDMVSSRPGDLLAVVTAGV